MNNTTNEALFKFALNEGLARSFESELEECTEAIICSPGHIAAMKRIINGDAKPTKSRTLSPKMKRIVVILIAAAFILASCAIAYRHEICGFIERIYDSFIAITYSDGEGENAGEEARINEVYELTYLTEGYSLESTFAATSSYRTVFGDSNNKIIFEQRPMCIAGSYLDVENGYTKIIEITKYDVYYRITAEHTYYLWNDGKYSMRLISDSELSVEELQRIINGIKIK